MVVEHNSVDKGDTGDFELALEVLLDIVLNGKLARIREARRSFVDHDPDRRARLLGPAIQKRLDEPIRLRGPIGERIGARCSRSTGEATISGKVPAVCPALPGEDSSLESKLCDVIGTDEWAVGNIEIWQQTREP